MAHLDSHLFFRVKEEEYLDKLQYEPGNVEVLDIVLCQNGEIHKHPKTLSPSQIQPWLHSPVIPRSNDGSRAVRGGLRIMFGVSSDSSTLYQNKTMSFSDDYLNIVRAHRVPLSRPHFQLVLDKFRLPRSTPWLCSTASGHFQRYSLEDESCTSDQLPLIGVTMKRTSRSVLAIDLSLSLSHDPRNRTTCAILFGASKRQTAFVKQQIQDLAQLCAHPAFLATLVCTYHRTLLQKLVEQVMEELFNVELLSGRSWIKHYDELGQTIPLGNCDHPDLTNRSLGVIQLATAWESYTKAVISDTECIQELIEYSTTLVDSHGKLETMAEDEVLRERLRFLANKAKMMLWRLQFVNQRAQAQQSAIYNYFAVKNNEINSGLAYDSRELALAGIRESYAMKSISVVTMLFLPGTFVATLFATPAVEKAAPPQWLYWAVTIPLTFVVMCVWAAWHRWMVSGVVARPNKDSNSSKPLAGGQVFENKL